MKWQDASVKSHGAGNKWNKESGVDEMFSLRESLNLEMSKLSRIRSSKLEEGWQPGRNNGEIEVVVSFLPVKGETPTCSEIHVYK